MSYAPLESLLSQLKGLVPAGTAPPPGAQQIQQANDVLRKLKLELVKLPTHPATPSDLSTVRSALGLKRETLEYACFLSLYARDVKSFERYVAQLKVLYSDYRALLPPSNHQAPIVGLYLLGLLAQNQIADFHTEYELLCHTLGSGPASAAGVSGPVVPPSPTASTLVLQNAVLSSAFIRFPIQLEAQLMEGCYTQILTAQKALPLPLYEIFMEKLSETVRSKIADCSELAYASLTFADLQQLLYLPNTEAVGKFVASRAGWSVKGDVVSFSATLAGQDEAAKKEIPSLKLIKQTLEYATELERIV